MYDDIANLLVENIRKYLRQSWQSKGYGGAPNKMGIGQKIATSDLYNYITPRIEYDEYDLPESFVIIMEDYWYWVDEGRKPGRFPPVNAIRNWILDKPINFAPINGKIPTLKQQTYLIGRSIAKKGTAGTDFTTLALDDTLDQALEIFGEQYADQIQEFLDLSIFAGREQDELLL